MNAQANRYAAINEREINSTLRHLFGNGHKIAAVKLFRAIYGVGLSDAYAALERRT